MLVQSVIFLYVHLNYTLSLSLLDYVRVVIRCVI